MMNRARVFARIALICGLATVLHGLGMNAWYQRGPLLAAAQELHIQGCNAEQLRRSLERNCIRVGRGGGPASGLELGPYGAAEPLDAAVDLEWLMSRLQVLSAPRRRSLPSTRLQLADSRFAKRSHQSGPTPAGSGSQISEDLCCQEECAISMEDLIPHCSSI